MPLKKPNSLLITALLLLASASASADGSPTRQVNTNAGAAKADRQSRSLHWDGLDRQMLRRVSEQAAKPRAPVFPAEKP
ncbi:hypothetical protein [Roseateles saccharophilus]|uniref:Uncharacterized protein n=1 Tax=Roseateles saccharophilus TaxID=304 RepID=A0A4R3UU05_ROSSA|nr:hypothetical protein [Roseateles saccharophilus]MDG0833230.1 hypothetical protein [Roseateles saccharophilus]TCU94421.1 hypothetical protein EV671_101766 [Roseateles saccharophilus]